MSAPRKVQRRRLLPGLGLLVCAGLSCTRCERAALKPMPPIERLLPSDSKGSLVVPSIARLSERLSRLERFKSLGFLARLEGFADTNELVGALMGQLGMDLRDRDALEEAGVDPTRSFGVTLMRSGGVCLVVPVKDTERLLGRVRQLARDRLGADLAEAREIGTVTLRTFRASSGSAVALGYIVAQGFAVMASGEHLDDLARLAALPETASLANDVAFAASSARLGPERDVWAYSPRGSALVEGLPAGSALLSLAMSEKALSLDADMPWKGDPDQLSIFQSRAPRSTAGALPADAFLKVQVDGEPAPVVGLGTLLLGPLLQKRLKDDGLRLAHDFAEMLRPGVSVGASLNPKPIGQTLFGSDPRRENPFSYVHLSAVAQAKQEEAIIPMLERLAAHAPQLGLAMTRTTRSGVPVFFTDGPKGENLHFGWRGAELFAASPIDRLDALLVNSPKPTPTGEGPTSGLSAVFDFVVLGRSVRALPDSSFGIGGYAMKTATLGYVDALSDFRRLTLASGTREGAVQAHLVLEFSEKAGTAKARSSARAATEPPSPMR